MRANHLGLVAVAVVPRTVETVQGNVAEVGNHSGASDLTPRARGLIEVRHEVQRGKVRQVENRIRSGQNLVQRAGSNPVAHKVLFHKVTNRSDLALGHAVDQLEATVKRQLVLVLSLLGHCQAPIRTGARPAVLRKDTG